MSALNSTYDRYHTQFLEAQRQNKYPNLTEAQYIQLAMTADVLHYQEYLVSKVDALEKAWKQAGSPSPEKVRAYMDRLDKIK